MLLPSTTKRCCFCTTFRNNNLLSALSHWKKQQNESCHPSSHTNYRCLVSPWKIQHMKNLHHLVRNQDRKIQHLQYKLGQLIQKDAIQVDKSIYSNLLSVIESQATTNEAHSYQYSGNNIKTFLLCSTKPMRWHWSIQL